MKRAGPGIDNARLPPFAIRLYFDALAYLRVRLPFGPGKHGVRCKTASGSKRGKLFFSECHILFDVLSEFAQSDLSIAVEIRKGFPGKTGNQHLGERPVSGRELARRRRSQARK